MKKDRKMKRSNIPLLLVLLLAILCMSGGCLGGGSGGGDSASPKVEVNVSTFKLADWDKQEWQLAGNPEGEVHPYLPLLFEMEYDTSRVWASNEDTLWVALSLVDDSGASALDGTEFDSENPAGEPLGDPRYLGFFCIKFESEGSNDITFEVDIEESVAAGNYKGVRAQIYIPGEMGEVLSDGFMDWEGNLTILDATTTAPIGTYWSEVTMQTDAPLTGNDLNSFGGARSGFFDAASGFQRLFSGTTPTTSADVDENTPQTGYYAELTVSQKILAPTGRVAYIEIKEANGLLFWNAATGQFEPTYRWSGKYASAIDIAANTATFSDGFHKGENGVNLVVGRDDGPPPAGLRVTDVRFSFQAFDASGNALGAVLEDIKDETLRATSRTAQRAAISAGDEIPFILTESESRVNAPVLEENRRIDFTRNMFEWEEDMRNTDAWGPMYGNNADYIGKGTRTVYSNFQGEKDYFAARAYILFEEYAGIVHPLPDNGAYAIHTVSTFSGLRAVTNLSIWVAGRQADLLCIGAEFRNEITGKTASEWDITRPKTDPYNLVGKKEQEHYANFSKSETEFNFAVKTMGVAILSYPMYIDNSKEGSAKFTDTTIFKYKVDAGFSALLAGIEIRVGADCTFYIDLQLRNKFYRGKSGGSEDPYTLIGEGRLAVLPGADIWAYVEGGVGCQAVSATLGMRMRFIDVAVGPTINLDATMAFNDGVNKQDNPFASVRWKKKPGVAMRLKTLDGEIYAKVKALVIEIKVAIFAWTGLEFNIEIWKGDSLSTTDLELPLRRKSDA